MIIKSIHNELIKQICSLKEKKERDALGLFIVEGKKSISEIKNDWKIKHIFVSDKIARDFDYDGQIIQASDKIIEKMSCVKTNQGILAVIEKKKFDIFDILNKGSLFMVLENISEPANLGSIIRSADAFNISAVFVSKMSADIYSDKTIRASMGSIFHIPVIDNIEIDSFFSVLKENNISSFASSLDSQNSLKQLKIVEKSAFFIGNEGLGLKKETIKQCGGSFKIDMTGKAQSLNAAIAASIIMYEIQKRRSKK
ncbi:MAG: RNA methyltransferase [Elusimicrobiota bacterium]|jgi:TrmH family RNA methyltransferase|nr:RNA methyltransferase [Elusimicrobiota bacterium]